jgi:hypothetical protein
MDRPWLVFSIVWARNEFFGAAMLVCRADYVATFVDRLADWEFAARNFQRATCRKAAE